MCRVYQAAFSCSSSPVKAGRQQVEVLHRGAADGLKTIAAWRNLWQLDALCGFFIIYYKVLCGYSGESHAHSC